MQIKKAIKKGFTLVELVVVIAVIAILAATSVGVYFGMLESANRSADQQAVVQMNKVLQIESILDGVDSILDVHEALEENGLTAEDYTALAKDHTFYFDTGYKKILYVNTSTPDYKVEYPTEYEKETYSSRKSVAEWYSLNLSIKAESVTASGQGTQASPKTYNVTFGEQFAYVMSTLANEPKDSYININVDGEINLRGANIAAKSNSHVNIIGSNGATIKNITSNEYAQLSTKNKDDELRSYDLGGLFVTMSKPLTISNVTFKNIYLENKSAGNIGIISGYFDGSKIELNNVTIESSKVVGNRSTGSVLGAVNGRPSIIMNNFTLKNVDVRTVSGRSALLIGHIATGFITEDNLKTMFTVSNIELLDSSFANAEGTTVYDDIPAGAVAGEVFEAGKGGYLLRTDSSTPKALGYNKNALVTYLHSEGIIRSIDTKEALMAL